MDQKLHQRLTQIEVDQTTDVFASISIVEFIINR